MRRIPIAGAALRRAEARRFERAMEHAFGFLVEQYDFQLRGRGAPRRLLDVVRSSAAALGCGS
jgi:hypothetical protein